MSSTARLGTTIGAVSVAVLLAACGGSGNDETTSTATTPAGVTTSAGGTTGSGTATTGTAPETAATTGNWAQPNGDLQNTRNVQGSSIDGDTVANLTEAWTSPIKGTGQFGAYASTPIILDGIVYTQDLNSNVSAIDEASGKVLWTHDFNEVSVGPNGVAVDGGKVFGATETFAFALDASTGKLLWQSPKLVRNGAEGIDMAPGVHDGLVYVSTVPGNAQSFYQGNGQGVLYALDEATGKTRWTFDTVPASLWGDKAVNSGGGLWHTPAFDENGSMYIDIANPAPFPGTAAKPWGGTRPGADPDTDTIVKLNAQTGEVEWKNQVLPHDVYDWDLHLPPVIVDTSDGQHLVLAAGKMGYVYAIDRDSGKLVWKRAVGQHNGHDNDNVLAMEGKLAALPKPPAKILPGIFGGVETQLAVKDDTVFAPIVNMAALFKNQTTYTPDLANGTGEMDAVDLKTGKVLWTHDFSTPVYGAATVVNDVVFTTTFDGTLHALDTTTGDEVWSTKLPAGTNATVAVAGDTLVTAASYPQGQDQQAVVVAYSLGAGGGTVQSGTTGAATTAPAPSTAGTDTTADSTP